jgi:hypothetical protein
MTCPSPGDACGPNKECCNLSCKVGFLPLGSFEGCCADPVLGLCGVIEEDADGGASCTLINLFLSAIQGIDCTPE